MRHKQGKLWRGFLLVSFLLCLTLAAAVCVRLWTDEDIRELTLTLKGEQEITLEYGEHYQEVGAEAWLIDPKGEKTPISVEVIQNGLVNDQAVGTYKVEYTAIYKEQSCTVYRTVHIVDTQAPVITLMGEVNVTILPTESYQEAGFTAADNYDGDLTDKVHKEEKDGVITYTVTDSSGNMSSVVRMLIINDPIAPVLELKGSNYVTVGIGSSYTEPGYTATDNCDGDLTPAVQVSGHVDLYKAGVYTLTYTVTDSFQNTSVMTREVCVLPLSQDDIGAPNGKVIYLTFDDGPGPYTDQLLDVLAKYNVKATFFVVNTPYISKIQRAANEGHVIGIHTATHKFSQVYASDEAYFEDLYKMQGIIEQYTGVKPTLLRFPGGSSNMISVDYNQGIMTRLTAEVEKRGFTYFDWNVDSDDAGRAKTVDKVFENVVNGIGNKQNAVVLQHDIQDFSVEAVEKIIVWGLKNGYTFRSLNADSPTCHHTINN